jgi:outer membrane protein assembly factor BamB
MPDAPTGRPRRRRLVVLGALAVILLAIGAGAAFLLSNEPGDVVNTDVPFTEETPAPAPPPDEQPRGGREPTFYWPQYGYNKARAKFLPLRRSLRPGKRVWAETGRILLEFPPIIAGRSLYLLKNNGALYAISKKTGRVRWKRKLGYLAASSPAYGDGRVYVTILQRGKGIKAGRVVAIRTKDGKVEWGRKLSSRSESSPVFSRGRVFFGSENGTVFSLRARDGDLRWTYKATGAVKSGLALANGKLFFGDYGGRFHAIRTSNGQRVWRKGTSGGRFGLSSGNFYSTPAVAFGRVYVGNTDGRVYSYATDNGALAWRVRTGGYVYSSPAVSSGDGVPASVYIGSYDGRFYALDARNGRKRWVKKVGGRISGGASVIGDVVYFSDYANRRTWGLGIRTGQQAWRFNRGAFNPMISDGRRFYLTGYSSLYAFEPAG